MRFIIQGHDVFHAHQFGQDALEHLAFGFQRIQVFTAPALEQGATAF